LVDTLDTEEDVAMAKKKRFTAEFKAQAVKLARESESTLSDVARDLGLPLSTLFQWVKKAHKEASTPEQGELARLRRENEQLRMERDFLKKAAAFFAKHQQ
jgi:transposase